MKSTAGKLATPFAAGMAAFSLLVSGVMLTSAPAVLAPEKKPSGAESKARIEKAVRRTVTQLPLAFEPNKGQTGGDANFLARGPGFTTFLTPTEAVLRLDRAGNGHQSVLRVQLLGSDPAAKPEGRNLLPGKVNYLKGPSRGWIQGVPTFSKVRYSGVYPGIDLVYYGNQRNLEYDFVVQPGADPSLARLRFEGADRVARRSNGDLVVTVGDETIVQRRPYVYQDTPAGRKEVPSRYSIQNQVASFVIGRYDTTRTLVIDPVISYSTYAGGGGPASADVGFGVAVDGDGNAYITGSTNSTNPTFPTKGPLSCGTTTTSFQCKQGLLDAFVAKINTNAAGADSLVWASVLGGDNDDVGFDVAVDDDGKVYVGGSTQSSDDPGTLAMEDGFPTTGNAYDTTCGTDGKCDAPLAENPPVNLDDPTQPPTSICRPDGTEECPTSPVPDAFLSTLSPDGTTLTYSTFLGGSGFEQESNPAAGALGHMDIAVRDSRVFVASTTGSSDFPTTDSGDSTCGTGGCNGRTDGFLSVLDTTESGSDSLDFSTYIGGDGSDSVKGVALDDEGNAYVAGTTNGTSLTPEIPGSPFFNNFPNTNLNEEYNGGPSDGFVAKVGAASFLEAHVKAHTKLNNLNQATKREPVEATAQSDGLIGPFLYSRFVGGGGTDEIWDVAVHDGNAYVTGFTDSGDDPATPAEDGPKPYFPTTKNAYDTTFNGQATSSFCLVPPDNSACTNSFLNGDAFVTTITEDGKDVGYSTFLGGIHGDVAHGIAVDSIGAAYVTGYTMCKNQTPGLQKCEDADPLNPPDYTGGSFPTTVDATQPTMGSNHLGTELHNSPTDGFVSKISPAGGGGSDLVFSTYIGGNNFDRGYAIAVRETPAGNEVYVTGRTGSTDFKTTPNAFAPVKPAGRGNRDAYLTKISL